MFLVVIQDLAVVYNTTFCPFHYSALFIDCIVLSKKYVIKFSCLTSLGIILSRPTAFLLLIFFNTVSSSFSVNSPNSTSSWPLIIFWIGLSVISEALLSRFLKCSFHFTSLSSWQAAFSFALDVFFLSFTSFTLYLDICDYLSLTEFLILLI